MTKEKLEQIIEEAKVILTYEESWDYDGALPISPDTFQKGVDFLLKYSEYFNADAYIDAGLNADILIEIFTNETLPSGIVDEPVCILFIIKPENNNIHFYGRNKKTEATIKGSIDIYAEVDAALSKWLLENLN